MKSANRVRPRPICPLEPIYPSRVIHWLGEEAPSTLYVAGEAAGLGKIEVALLCSVSCPGSVIIKTFDAIRSIRDAGIVVAGGFHSPMERDCLHFLLRGSQQVILSPAYGIEGLSFDCDEQAALNEGRLIAVSVFARDVVKASPDGAVRRNRFVAATADILLVPHAVPGGKVQREAQLAISRGQTVLTFNDDDNLHLVSHGAVPIEAEVLTEIAGYQLTRHTT